MRHLYCVFRVFLCKLEELLVVLIWFLPRSFNGFFYVWIKPFTNISIFIWNIYWSHGQYYFWKITICLFMNGHKLPNCLWTKDLVALRMFVMVEQFTYGRLLQLCFWERTFSSEFWTDSIFMSLDEETKCYMDNQQRVSRGRFEMGFMVLEGKLVRFLVSLSFSLGMYNAEFAINPWCPFFQD